MSNGVEMVEKDLKESYIGVPPQDILKILLLTKRDNTLEAIEAYLQQKNHSGDAPIHVMRARVQSLFLEVEHMLTRAVDKEAFDKMYNEIFLDEQVKGNVLITAFRKINKMLDTKRITRLDLGKDYDSTNIELENYEKGM